MARQKVTLWLGKPGDPTNTKERVNRLADIINAKLVPAHHVDVVELTEDWWLIVGTPQAKAVYDKLKEEAINKEDKADTKTTFGNPFTSDDVKTGKVSYR